MLVAALVVAVALAAAVPALQPTLYHADNPAGSCSSGAAAGPCGSFWGSASSSGTQRVWGSGAGWGLDLALVGVLALAFAIRLVGGREHAGEPRSSGRGR